MKSFAELQSNILEQIKKTFHHMTKQIFLVFQNVLCVSISFLTLIAIDCPSVREFFCREKMVLNYTNAICFYPIIVAQFLILAVFES